VIDVVRSAAMRLAVLAAALAGGACNTGVRAVELGPLDASPDCEALRGHSDLATIQTGIFDKNCASSTACHKTSIDDSADLSLADGMSWANLVGVDAKSKIAMSPTQWKRVVAGDPANSYLMVLVDPKTDPIPAGPSDPNGYDGPLDPKVGAMPQNYGGLLCPEKIQAIHDWIAAGAPAQ
jgi:hypothetical protein